MRHIQDISIQTQNNRSNLTCSAEERSNVVGYFDHTLTHPQAARKVYPESEVGASY